MTVVPILPQVTRIIAFLAIIFLLWPAETGSARRYPKSGHSRTSSKIKKERSSKESELTKLKSEIAKYQTELRDHEQREKRSKKNLTAFNRRTEELKAAIDRLESRVSQLEEQKTEVDRSIKETASNLDQLKSAHANSARLMYMHGRLKSQNADQYLFAPGKPEESLRERYYAHVIGEAHAMSRGKLDSMKVRLGAEGQQIASSLNNQQALIERQAQEQQAIEARRLEEAKQLDQIQHNKDRLKKLIAQRQASAKRLEGIIANLLLREEATRKSARAKRHSAGGRSRSHGRTPAPSDDEEVNVGPAYGPHSLSWPTATHHVKQGFGEHRNAELNTVTMNLGIDIAASEGTSVMAAAEGQVSLVSTLPSYGTIIVLQHSGGLHTVYADLSGVSVHVGGHVRAGQLIGRSGSNEESGALLHFEVWKGKSKQNPMGWLR